MFPAARQGAAPAAQAREIRPSHAAAGNIRLCQGFGQGFGSEIGMRRPNCLRPFGN
jgi:hypothetical protein